VSILQLQTTISIHRRRLQPLKYDIANYNIAIAIMAQRMQQMSLDQQPLSIKERFQRIMLPVNFSTCWCVAELSSNPREDDNG